MRLARLLALVVCLLCLAAALHDSRFLIDSALAVHAQNGISDADLAQASMGRTVTIGTPSSGDRRSMPLEVYVARVLAGEGEPRAADAARQALAIAIRTFAIVNAGRHARDGYDLCDTTHCQVLRTATDATRSAALATAERVLMYHGKPAEVFYSASCGGRTESAANLWPSSSLPYLVSVDDDVHGEDTPWTLDVPLARVQARLERAGFEGRRLADIRVESRNDSGRVARLRIRGMEPAVISGAAFRAAMDPADFRSTAFDVETDGATAHFSGTGYGHGVGLCVIGAGRRAARGESVQEILATYFPGLTLSALDSTPALESAARPSIGTATLSASKTTNTPTERGIITVRVPRGSSIDATEIARVAQQAYADVSRALDAASAGITIEVHESVDTFRGATGRPWWVSAVAEGSTIDLAPPAILAQRGGLAATLRVAIADLIVSSVLSDRPEWIHVGAARYFGRAAGVPVAATPSRKRPSCPADADLTLAISAAAQREAEARAEACFARALASVTNWRAVR